MTGGEGRCGWRIGVGRSCDGRGRGEEEGTGANGVLFSGPEELARHLLELLNGWYRVGGAGDSKEELGLERLRRGASAAGTERWAENWERCAKPLFE